MRPSSPPNAQTYRPHAGEGRERVPSTPTRPLYPRPSGQTSGNTPYTPTPAYAEEPSYRSEHSAPTWEHATSEHYPGEAPYARNIDDYAATLHADVAPTWDDDEAVSMGYGDWESDDTPPTYRRADVEIVTRTRQEHATGRAPAQTEAEDPASGRGTRTLHESHVPAYAPHMPAGATPSGQETRHYQRMTQPLSPQMAHQFYREREQPPTSRPTQLPGAQKAQVVPSIQKAQTIQSVQPMQAQAAMPRQLARQEPTQTITIPPPLAPKALCARCKGAGYLRADVPFGHPNFGKPIPCVCKEQERKEKRRLQLREMSNLEAFREKTFRTFNPNVPGVQESYQVAAEYAQNPNGWLLLIGRSGSGKTHLAAAVANQALNDGALVLFTIVPDLLFELRASISSKSPETQEQLFLKMREAEVLILDDFGAHRSSPWTTEKLFQLLNYRYNMEMPTIITTNPEGIQGADPRILSRLTDNSLVTIVKMERARDYRPNHPRA